MLKDDPVYGTFRRLVELQTELWNALDSVLRERHGVSLAHMTVLQVTTEVEDCRVQDIVATLHITVGGASKAVDRLAAAGHLERERDPHDGRSSLLRVTPAGRALLDAVAPDLTALLADRVAGALAPPELERFDRTLRTLQDGAPRESQ